MGEILQRLAWFTVAAIIVAYASELVLGSIVNKQSQYASPVVVRDELAPNAHYLSGILMVPSSCDELSVRTDAISQNSFALVFTTWRDPSVDCSSDEAARDFRAVLIAPAAGVDIFATLDGTELPILLLPVVPGHQGR